MGPAIALLAAFCTLVFLRVRADRLADLDASLEARAGALASYVEYDDGWELDPIPDHVLRPLAGYEVRDGDEVLLSAGRLVDRTWTGSLRIESNGPEAVEVRVSQDAGPVRRALLVLVGELAALGLGLSGVAVVVGLALSRRIVASEDFQRLQAAWERQAAFTAAASHELRTPLAVVRSQAEVALRQERSPEQYRAALTDIVGAAARMQDLIEGLLVLARADERFEAAPVDLVPVITAALAAVEPRPGVDLRAELPDTARPEGDARLLRVLVDNLVSNAIRHTHAGAVRVRLTAEGAGWRLEVADTGEGIPPEHLGHVFERFYRADGARSRSAGGAGLGLAIARAIAEQHGGTVAIRSVVGEGTIATVQLGGGVR